MTIFLLKPCTIVLWHLMLGHEVVLRVGNIFVFFPTTFTKKSRMSGKMIFYLQRIWSNTKSTTFLVRLHTSLALYQNESRFVYVSCGLNLRYNCMYMLCTSCNFVYIITRTKIPHVLVWPWNTSSNMYKFCLYMF